MTDTTTTSALSLSQTIETDLSTGLKWAEGIGEGVALGLWNVLKNGFIGLTMGQGQVVLNVLNRLEADAAASMSLEEIETDLLNTAVMAEAELIRTVSSTTLQALIASWKAGL